MVAEQKPDVVHNCLPHYLHFPVTKENVASFRKAIDELNFNFSSLTASIDPLFPGMPDMSGQDGMAKFVSAFFDKPVRFAELGAGSLPLKACIETGIEGGAEYFLIEQDDSYGRDPFDWLKDSRAHLVELGYESWF